MMKHPSAAFNPSKLAIACFAMITLVSNAFCKRIDPPDITPIQYRGLEYSAPTFPAIRQKSHRIIFDGRIGGVVEIRDIETRKLIKTVLVYKNYRFPLLEGDVQDVFISAMTLDSSKKRITILDEHGGSYILDLQTNRLSGLRGLIVSYGWLLAFLIISIVSIIAAPKIQIMSRDNFVPF